MMRAQVLGVVALPAVWPWAACSGRRLMRWAHLVLGKVSFLDRDVYSAWST
jgi:hypothetical protein